MRPKAAHVLTAVALFLLMASCGGGGGSSKTTGSAKSLSGVAAAGAPIIGLVTLKDSSTPPIWKYTQIAANGGYTVDVTGLTAPFALRAEGTVGGKGISLYSAAVSADVGGTVNITPFTDLMLANIAQTVAKSYFEGDQYKNLTPTQLTTAETALQTKLQPILTAMKVPDSIDLLRSSMSANRTGLDAVLDMVKVSVDPVTLVAEIQNVVTQNQVTMDVATGSYTGGFTSGDGAKSAAGLTDLDQIAASFTTFTNLFAAAPAPSTSNQTLRSLFDETNFMNDGQNLDAFLTDVTTSPDIIGIAFTNITLLSLTPDAVNPTQSGVGTVGFEILKKGVRERDGTNVFKVEKTAGVWKMQGNGKKCFARVEPRGFYFPGAQSENLTTGLYLEVEDRGGKNVDHALIVGPGLPQGGVLMVRDISHSWFDIAGDQNMGGFYRMDDAKIGQMPAVGAEYTITIYDSGNNVMDLYTETIGGRPLMPSEQTTANFPAISTPTLSGWRNMTIATSAPGTTIQVNFTRPKNTYYDYTYAQVDGTQGNASVESKSANPAATSDSLVLIARTATSQAISPITWKWLEVGVSDDLGRRFTTVLN